MVQKTEQGQVLLVVPELIEEIANKKGENVKGVKFEHKWVSESGWMGFFKNEGEKGLLFQPHINSVPVHNRIVIFRLKPNSGWDKRKTDENWERKRTPQNKWEEKRLYRYDRDPYNSVEVWYDEHDASTLINLNGVNVYQPLPKFPAVGLYDTVPAKTTVLDEKTPFTFTKSPEVKPEGPRLLTQVGDDDIPYSKLSAAQQLYVDHLIDETGIEVIDYAIRRVKQERDKPKPRGKKQ